MRRDRVRRFEQLAGRYPEVASLSATKPIAVLEYGYAERSRAPVKASWIRGARRAVARGRWPRIVALSYWHEEWQNGDGTISDIHIDSSRRALRTYRRGADRAAFTSLPAFAAR